MKNYAIIPAGGQGKRLLSSTKKQFLEIGGSPILLWTLVKFVNHPAIHKIVIVFPKEDFVYGRQLVENEYLSLDSTLSERFIFTTGGAKRQDSVFNGIKVCPPDTDYVLIHDAVRPFIEPDDINQLLQAAQKDGAAIPVSPVKNTIKQIRDGFVQKTIPRDSLVEVYTPQVFRYPLIREFHEKAQRENIYCTDDAGILEHFGQPVTIVLSSPRNIKITDRFDLYLARQILSYEGSKAHRTHSGDSLPENEQ